MAADDTTVDTGGEFASAADRPELGQDGTRWVRETAVPDAPDEFATSRLCRLAAPGMMKIRWRRGGARFTGHLRASPHQYPRSFGEGGYVGTRMVYFWSS